MLALRGIQGETTLHQMTICIAEPANDILRALAAARDTTRQGIVEPVVEDFARAHVPLVFVGLQAMIETLGRSEEFPDFSEQIATFHADSSDEFPLVPLDPTDKVMKTGIRITPEARTIFRTIAIMEGHTMVGPQIEPLINGYALGMADSASEELGAYAQRLRPPDTAL
jgi:hypothetical protein